MLGPTVKAQTMEHEISRISKKDASVTNLRKRES